MRSGWCLSFSYFLWLTLVLFTDTADDAFHTPYCDNLRRVFHILWHLAVFVMGCVVNYEIYFGRHGVFPLNR